MTVDIVLSVHNGMPYLPELLASVQRQTHEAWRLWVRDDGSSDGSAAAVEAFAARDPRIRLLAGGAERLGAAGSYGWLLARSELEQEYTLFCDADDVWLPDRVERMLAAAAREASAAPGPLLLHTDLVVVDRDLRLVAESFWRYRGLRVEPSGLRRLLYQNVVTGPTMMVNRSLRERLVPIPHGAVYQDWWVALVAAAFGRIVALPEPTVLYRQHGANSVGADAGRRGSLLGRVLPGGERALSARRELARAVTQAEAFRRRFAGQLRPEDEAVVCDFAGMLEQGPLARRWRIFTLARTPDQSGARALARALLS